MKTLQQVLGYGWKGVCVLFSIAFQVAMFLLYAVISLFDFFAGIAADLMWGSMIYETTDMPPMMRRDD